VGLESPPPPRHFLVLSAADRLGCAAAELYSPVLAALARPATGHRACARDSQGIAALDSRMTQRERFWHWPSVRQLGWALLLGTAETALFLICYGGANWLTKQHSWRVPVHCSLDRAMPLLPPAVLFYVSVNPLMWMAPLVLCTVREMAA